MSTPLPNKRDIVCISYFHFLAVYQLLTQVILAIFRTYILLINATHLTPTTFYFQENSSTTILGNSNCL